MAKHDKAIKIYEWYQKIREDTVDWRERRDRCKKAYFGMQWESDVSERIRARGQVDVVINGIRTLIRNRVSTMIAQKPTGKIYGVSKNDIGTAVALQDFMDYLWYNSQGQIRAERVVMSQNREGVGYFVVYPDPKADYGRGELKITDEIWRHVWIPKSAGREWDYSDSPYIILSKLIHQDEFYKSNPGYKGKLTPELFHPNDEIYWSGKAEHEEQSDFDLPEGISGEGEFIREFDTYERFHKDVQIIYNHPTGTIQIVDDNYTPTNEENDLIKGGLISLTKAPVPRIQWTKTFGEKIVRHSEVLPIEHYPVIPVPDEDTGNVMPLGEIDQSFGVQELANKAFSIMIQHAALTSTNKMVVDAARGGIKDINKLQEDWGAPGLIVDMIMDKATGKFPYQIERPEPLNQAFYTIFERMLQQLQFSTATFGSKLGDTSNAPQTYSATLQYGEWQQDNLRIPLSRLEMGIQRVFDILLQWTPNYYTFPKVYDVIKENEVVGQGSINMPQREGNVWKVMNNISEIKARYRIRLGSTMPAQSTAHMNLYKELAAVNPLFLKYLVEYLPIKEKDKLVQELDLVAKLQGQVQEQESQVNTLSGMVQNLLRQQAETEIKQDVDETKLELKKLEQEYKLKQKEELFKIKSKEKSEKSKEKKK